jgi:hypothetical protein
VSSGSSRAAIATPRTSRTADLAVSTTGGGNAAKLQPLTTLASTRVAPGTAGAYHARGRAQRAPALTESGWRPRAHTAVIRLSYARCSRASARCASWVSGKQRTK